MDPLGTENDIPLKGYTEFFFFLHFQVLDNSSWKGIMMSQIHLTKTHLQSQTYIPLNKDISPYSGIIKIFKEFFIVTFQKNIDSASHRFYQYWFWKIYE